MKMIRNNFELFNATAVTETDDGAIRPVRVPEAVRSELNSTAQNNYLRPAGTELRVVAPPNESVSVTLSSMGASRAVTFHGPFQTRDVPAGVELGRKPTSIECTTPELLGQLTDRTVAEYAFDPCVHRLLLQGDPVTIHDVSGDTRPPRDHESPDGGHLAYGTSITQASRASLPHQTYVHQAGRHANLNSINLGTSGSAYCETAIADYIAQRNDWDVVTLELSVNMVAAGFTLDTFEQRTRYMIETIADANPDASVLPMTLFPLVDDLTDEIRHEEGAASPDAFRDTLRSVTADLDRTNVRLIEGPELLEDPTGLSSDLCHPGDAGMGEIGRNLAEELKSEV